jgi:hypothetical protein
MAPQGAIMFRIVRRGTAPAVLALLMAACSSNTTPTTTTPTPTPTTITDTFSGTLTKNGGHTHPFAVAVPGVVTATLVSLTPDSTLVVGLALGTWNGTACQVILPADNATQGTVVTGNISSAGNLCVRVYDSTGNVVNIETYQINVAHP